jgi:hypothetical protein
MHTGRAILALIVIAFLAACRGPAGPPGAAGVGGYELKSRALPLQVPEGLDLPIPIPPCPDGKKVLGGGAEISSGLGQVRVVTSRPSDDGITWRVTVRNDGPGNANATLTVTMICALVE